MNRRKQVRSKTRKKIVRLQDSFRRGAFIEFKKEQPMKPLIENAGKKGKTLARALADFRQQLHDKRQQLQADCNAEKPKGAPRITVRTIKDVIVFRILEGKATRLNRHQLSQKPMGALQEYLPRFDWRDLGLVPPVRDQGKCNSCWAITATQAFEASLMRQLTNFSLNEENEFPEMFFVPQIGLNIHSTMDCVEPHNCNQGRTERAFNYYFEHGIPAREIILNSVRLDQQDMPNSVYQWGERDAELPKRHCNDEAGVRIKIIGWDYVHRNAWRIPSKKAMKTALLEHGPLVVAINTVGLMDFSARRLVDRSVEIGSNPGSGIVFKREMVSGGLLACVPTKYMEKQTEENLDGRAFNLSPSLRGSEQYRFLPAAAQAFVQGKHRRAAPTDLNVGKFHEHDVHRLNDLMVDKLYERETDSFIFHFPRSNGVKLAQDPLTDNFHLRFPINSKTKLKLDKNTGQLTMIIPWRFPEDLDPVFDANPELRFNHYVLLVGWDDEKKAWIIQNSWGDDWGFACNYFGGDGYGKGYAYVRYGTLGQYAAWIEADLLEEKFRKPSAHGQDGGGARAQSWSGKPSLPSEYGE